MEILCRHIHLNGQISKKSILENILPHLNSRFTLVAFFLTSFFSYYLETYQYFYFFIRLSILCL
jgi:hypothetical protein